MSENSGNTYTFEMVVQKLKNYADLQLRAKLLKFEIENYDQAIKSEEMIESMTFSRTIGDSSGVGHGSQITNRTADIAISHEERTAGLNRKFKDELENDLRSVNMNLLRLETYVNLLQSKHSKVLQMLYFKGLSLAETAESLNLTVETAKNYRKAGIKKLVEMYNSILR